MAPFPGRGAMDQPAPNKVEGARENSAPAGVMGAKL